MNNSKGIIIIKPDAINATVGLETAKSLFQAFANHLSIKCDAKLSPDMLVLKNNAEKQILERSITELTFQGDLTNINSHILENFIDISTKWENPIVSIVDIITQGLYALGCEIQCEIKYVFNEHDINEIYLVNTHDSLHDLSTKLYSYLCGHEIIIIKVSCINGSFLLHHWKTFVRHFCILNRTEKFPLKNLLHVCEEDYEYVNKLCKNRRLGG